MSVQEQVKAFIVENFYVSDPSELAEDTLLVSSGYVDSTGMLEIIAFLEAEYAIQITDEETTPENLESIGRIAVFVGRKRQAVTAA
jgi:acyl carrier protein